MTVATAEHTDIELVPRAAPARPLAERPQASVPALHSDSSALTQAIIAAAHDPSVNIEKMERLLSMHERITARSAEEMFNTAMAAAQARMERISADAVNPQTRSKYATYAQLDRHLRPIYTAHGFALSFNTGQGAPEGHARVLCYVSNAGHMREYHIDMPADGKGANGNDAMTKTHATGSAVSYGMRYLLKLIFNVAIGEDDDDGNSAGGCSYTPTVADWIKRVQSTKTRTELTRVMREGNRQFKDQKDRAGYTAFAHAIQAHGATLPVEHAHA